MTEKKETFLDICQVFFFFVEVDEYYFIHLTGLSLSHRELEPTFIVIIEKLL